MKRIKQKNSSVSENQDLPPKYFVDIGKKLMNQEYCKKSIGGTEPNKTLSFTLKNILIKKGKAISLTPIFHDFSQRRYFV